MGVWCFQTSILNVVLWTWKSTRNKSTCWATLCKQAGIHKLPKPCHQGHQIWCSGNKSKASTTLLVQWFKDNKQHIQAALLNPDVAHRSAPPAKYLRLCVREASPVYAHQLKNNSMSLERTLAKAKPFLSEISPWFSFPPNRKVSQLFGVKTNSPSVATSWANTRNISSCPASADDGTWSQGIVFSFSLELQISLRLRIPPLPCYEGNSVERKAFASKREDYF